MAKVKFKFAIKEITFEYEGDHETGRAISDSMHHTLGSLAEAQNAVIDITPREEERPALPPPSHPTPPHRKRKARTKPKPQTNGDGVTLGNGPAVNGEPTQAKAPKHRRPKSEGCRAQMYRMLAEGYFSQPRTAAAIQSELSTKRGFTFDIKRITSVLTEFTKKGYLKRDLNSEGKFAYVKGPNNDYPGSQGGS